MCFLLFFFSILHHCLLAKSRGRCCPPIISIFIVDDHIRLLIFIAILRGRLLAHHQVHRREEVQLRARDEAIGGLGERVGGLLGAAGGEADALEDGGGAVGEGAAPPRHADDGEGVEDGLHVLPLAGEGPPPGDGVGALGEVLVVQEVEAGAAHGLEPLGDLHHVGDAVALLDPQPDLPVLQVRVVVVVRHQPLVHPEHPARLQHPEDLAVHPDQLRRVHRRLDGVDGVEGVVGEVHLLFFFAR